jgi:hypothetical protein
MRTSTKLVITCAAALLSLSGAAAVAQEVILDDDYPAAIDELRPADCGTFYYWDGEACVDARLNPPGY